MVKRSQLTESAARRVKVAVLVFAMCAAWGWADSSGDEVVADGVSIGHEASVLSPSGERADAVSGPQPSGKIAGGAEAAASTGAGLVFTYIAWILVPAGLILASVLISVRAMRDKSLARIEQLERELSSRQSRDRLLQDAAARQRLVVNKLSAINLVDQVSGASRHERMT